jgi:hypothetical protein
MFSPTAEQAPEGLRDPMMPGFAGDRSAEPRNPDASFPMFRPNTELDLGLDVDDDLRNGLANIDHTQAHSTRGSPPVGEYDNMFMDLGNHDGDVNHDVVPSLEQEHSHASEALDMIRRASNDSTHENAEMEDGETISKHFDDFVNGDDAN